MIPSRRKWFHSTDAFGVERIREAGFWVLPAEDQVSEYYDLYSAMLGPERAVQMKLLAKKTREHGPGWKRAVADLMREWVERFGNGTLIWVSDIFSPGAFGDYTFKVKLPKDARLVYEHLGEWLFYVPNAPIPPENFVPVEE